MEEQSQSSAVRRYLAVIQRWLWLIVLTTLVAAAAAYVASRLSTPIYEASSILLVNGGETAAGPDYNGVLMSERLVGTYSQLLKGPPIYEGIRALLKLNFSDAQMDRMIIVEPVRDTQLITLKVRSADAGLAARIANTAPQVLIQQNFQASARLASIIVAQPAKTPTVPVLPRTLLNTLLAAFSGMVIGVGSAFLFEYADDTIKSPSDVERISHLPTLASVLRSAHMGAQGEEPLVALRGKSPLAEGYRELRTNMQFLTKSDVKAGGQVLMITSSQPLEGKTTTLANLGVSLARIGRQVILVDADLRRPALHRPFGLRNQMGLTTLLMKRKADPNEAIQETSVKGLRVLTAGPIPANPAELLDSPETPAIIEELRGLADYVLIDTPPALSVTDASILAQKVDGVLLVAEMGRVRSDVFWHAVAALEKVRAPIIGVVLNKVRARPGSYGYYHYGYGTSEEPAAEKPPSLGKRISSVTTAAGSTARKPATPAQATTQSAGKREQK